MTEILSNTAIVVLILFSVLIATVFFCAVIYQAIHRLRHLSRRSKPSDLAKNLCDQEELLFDTRMEINNMVEQLREQGITVETTYKDSCLYTPEDPDSKRFKKIESDVAEIGGALLDISRTLNQLKPNQP